MAKTFQQEIDEALKSTKREGYPVDAPAYFIPMWPDEGSEHAHRQAVLPVLQQRQQTQGLKTNRLHIGTAGFFNFDIAAITRPDAILLLDYNKNQARFWEEMVWLLQHNETPQQFYDAFETANRCGRDRKPFCIPGRQPVRIHGFWDYQGKYLDHASWLVNPDAYAHLRQLALAGKIAAVTTDLVHDGGMAKAIGKFLREKGFTTDTCYWSNLGSFYLPERKSLPKQFTSSTDGVFPEDLEYTINSGLPFSARWTGEGKPERMQKGFTSWVQHRALAADLPPWEKLLRIVSAIGGDEGMHMLFGNDRQHPMIITEGPPRDLERLAFLRSQERQKDWHWSGRFEDDGKVDWTIDKGPRR